MAPSSPAEKARENRVRAAAMRRDLRLVKSRARDRGDTTFGTFQLVDVRTNTVAFADPESPRGFGRSLDEVEVFLQTYARQ